MKWGKRFLALLLVVLMVSNLFVYKVNAATNITISDNSFSYVRIVNNIMSFTTGTNLSGVSYYHLYNGEIDVSIVCDSGFNFSQSVITNNTNTNKVSYGVGNSSVFQLSMGYLGVSTLPLGNYQVTVTFKNALWELNSYLLNGSFSYRFSILSYNVFYTVTGLTTSFNLSYNNDYNYTSNKASFTMQPSNFTFQYFSFLNTDLSNSGALGGFHLLNYSVSGNTLNVSFDNTYINVPNPHYLVFTAVGLDYFGNQIELSGNVSFNLNASNNQYNGMKFRVYYSPEISPCSSGVALGYFFFAVDSGDGNGYKDVDGSKYTLVVGVKQVNGNPDVFNVDLEQYDVYSKAYAIRWNNPDNEPVDTYHFIINYLGLTFEGDFDPCKNSWIDFDQTGNITNNQTYDWKDFLKQIRDIFVGLWNLILSIVNFFSALLLAILNVLYSLGVAIVSLLKIIFDFFASVSSIIFNRDTNYYSIATLVNIPNSISYGGKVIALPGLVGQFDNVLRYLHDNIILKYNAVWSLIAVIILIQRHIVKDKDMEDGNG